MVVLIGSKKVNSSKITVITVMVIITIADPRATRTKIFFILFYY